MATKRDFAHGIEVRDFLQGQMTSMDKAANVVLDIEGLPQQPDKCCTGSPKMTVCSMTHIRPKRKG